MSAGTWRVMDGARIVETHGSPRAAHRALMILSAHEILNERVADYRVDPPIDLNPIETLDLPDWALEALKLCV